MMKSICIRIILVICGLQFTACLMYKYDIEFLTDKMFTPCEKYPDNRIENFADISGLNIILNDDGSITVEGVFELIYDFKKTEYKANIEFYKRERGTWHKTLYSIKRKDVCTSVFSPNEMWSPYLTQVPVEQRICPIEKGRVYNVSVTTKDPLELPDRNMAGEYNIRYEAGDPEDGEFFCTDSFVNLYRH